MIKGTAEGLTLHRTFYLNMFSLQIILSMICKYLLKSLWY